MKVSQQRRRIPKYKGQIPPFYNPKRLKSHVKLPAFLDAMTK